MAVMEAPKEVAPRREATRQRPLRFTPVPSSLEHDAVAPVAGASWAHLYQAAYAMVDAKTGGRAAEVLRLVTFLAVGGSASLLNLACVWSFDRLLHPTSGLAIFLVLAAATEISLLANFLLNDRFTFRTMVGEHRTFVQRGVRFHGPAMVGFGLTLLISNLAHHVAHLTLTTSQGVAILIVTVVNFLMHRHWTYREVHPARAL
ncbi:MAG: GtrA family protein [Ktedonobacterales bacterium]|nr:GtrA family protein [Ktedonobacterales bacterium]